MKLLFCFLLLAFNSILLAGPKKLPPKPTEEMKPLLETQMVRIDPHGKVTDKKDMSLVEKNRECLVCHTANSKKIQSTVALETCYNCHNKAPHSGVVEHTVRDVTCISCHSFHRWDISHSASSSNNSGIFSKMKGQQSTDGFVVKNGSGLMLKKDCKDCHQWK